MGVCNTRSIWIFCRRKCLCCRGVSRGSSGHWISFVFGIELYRCWNPSNPLLWMQTDYSCCPRWASHRVFRVPFEARRGGFMFHTNNTNSFLFILWVIIIYCTTSEHFLSSQWQNMLHFFTWAEHNVHKFKLHKHQSKQQDSIMFSFDNNSQLQHFSFLFCPVFPYHISLFPLISVYAGT